MIDNDLRNLILLNRGSKISERHHTSPVSDNDFKNSHIWVYFINQTKARLLRAKPAIDFACYLSLEKISSAYVRPSVRPSVRLACRSGAISFSPADPPNPKFWHMLGIIPIYGIKEKKLMISVFFGSYRQKCSWSALILAHIPLYREIPLWLNTVICSKKRRRNQHITLIR